VQPYHPVTNAKHNENITALSAVVGAYLIWGFSPIFWKHLLHVSHDEILAHRIIWSLIFTGLSIFFLRSKTAKEPKLSTKEKTVKWGYSLICSILVGLNWLLYIIAVNSNRIVEASLAYFLSPLLIVFAGKFFLKEEIRPYRRISIALAFCGVLSSIIAFRAIPWMTITISLTWVFYTILHKKCGGNPIAGLNREMTILTPLTVAYLIFYVGTENMAFFSSSEKYTTTLLIFSGVLTALPLVLFQFSAKRLPMITVGMMQYISPTLQLMTGCIIYGEVISTEYSLTFPLVWIALIVDSTGMLLEWKKRRRIPVKIMLMDNSL
jgi:chloramphenicol-sensitive protein RarD